MYTLILNSNNRVDKENTTASNCEYNFDWGAVIPEGKYKLTYSLSRFTTFVPSPFQTLLINKRPWGKYSPASYKNNLWSDESLNNRHATCVGIVPKITVANGASSPSGVNCLSGTIESSIVWPFGSIPSNYTICVVSRYSGSVNTQRILTDVGSTNVVLGHYGYYGAEKPVIYDNGFQLRGLNQGNTNWLSLCVIRGTSVPIPNNVIVDNVAVGVNQITNTSFGSLGVNTSTYGEKSDFEICHVLIWDAPLTSSELFLVSNAFNTYLTTGILI
jgi:hypothetical protein